MIFFCNSISFNGNTLMYFYAFWHNVYLKEFLLLYLKILLFTKYPNHCSNFICRSYGNAQFFCFKNTNGCT